MHWNRVARLSAIVAMFVPRLLFAQGLESDITPQRLVEVALERNRDYLAAQAKISEADALLRQAGVRPNPSLEIEAASGKLLGSSGESSFSAAYFHTIERGGKRDRRIEVARLGKKLAQAEAGEYRRQMTFSVKTQYARTAVEKLKLAAIERLLPAHQQNYQLTASRVELGDAAPLEQQLLLTDINRTQARQLTVSAHYSSALLELKTAVGLSSSDSLDIPATIALEGPAAQLAELVAFALEHRPDLQVLLALEEQSEAEAAQARAEGVPDLTASVRYTRTNAKFEQLGLANNGLPVPIIDHDNIAAVGIAIPVFGRNRTEGATGAALARKTAARLRSEHLMTVIPQEVEAAFQRWQGAERTLQLLKTGVVDQSEKNLTVIREAYRLGQLRLFDVMNEQRKLIETELEFVDAQMDAAQAVIDLERAVGGILP